MIVNNFYSCKFVCLIYPLIISYRHLLSQVPKAKVSKSYQRNSWHTKPQQFLLWLNPKCRTIRLCFDDELKQRTEEQMQLLGLVRLAW